ncbi:MAG: hypothetical protein IJM44_05705 [Ruminococcus sp.]|jgi:hypothetical protein|nr:hypothetical protein [Ruminococcus sp.]
MAEKKQDTLNDKVKKAIEDILSEMSPPAEDKGSVPATDEEFEAEQKRHIRD